jgi:hypothetical protein
LVPDEDEENSVMSPLFFFWVLATTVGFFAALVEEPA